MSKETEIQKEAQAVPQAAPANGASKQPEPMFTIIANTPRELALRVAQALLRHNKFKTFDKLDKMNRKTGQYALWNLTDDGKIAQGFNQGITLTAEEAKMLPTDGGVPVVFSIDVALRQLTPVNALAAKIVERQIATATRSADSAGRASTDDLLAELNKRRIANGEKPIEG